MSEQSEVKRPTQAQLTARLNVRIDGFIKRSHDMATEAHALLCDCLAHAETYGDARPLDRLISGMSKRDRPMAAREWVSKYSPVRWNGDGAVGLLKAFKKDGTPNPLYTPWNIDEARQEPYWTPSEAETGKKPLTLEALIAMANRISTEVEKKAKAGLIGDGEDINAMRMFAARIKDAAAVQLVVDNSTLAPKVTIVPAPTPVVVPAPVAVAA